MDASDSPPPCSEKVIEHGEILTVKRNGHRTMIVEETQEEFCVEGDVTPSSAYWMWRKREAKHLPPTKKCLEERLMRGRQRLREKAFSNMRGTLCPSHQYEYQVDFTKMGRMNWLQPTCRKCNHDLFMSGKMYFHEF